MSKVKPDNWSEALWEAFKLFGESDKKYVESCNRFLDVMLDLRLDETLMLVRGLMHVMVLNEEVPLPEEFKSGIPSVDLALAKEKDHYDYFDVYRAWYSQYVEWPEECLCGREDVVMDSGATLSRAQPWFLTACIQLARRALLGEVKMDIDIYVQSDEPIEPDDPIPEDANFLIRAGQEIEIYLTKGLWRIDDGPTEDLDIQLRREPEESRRAYINRVKELVETYLIYGMSQADQIAQHPKVALAGKPLDPANKHEEMLVRRMAGQPIPEIVAATQDALLNKKGEPLDQLERTIYNRTNLIAKHLGFIAPAAEETS